MKTKQERVPFSERQHPKWALDGRFALHQGSYIFDDDNNFPDAPHFRIGADGWIPESEATNESCSP